MASSIDGYKLIGVVAMTPSGGIGKNNTLPWLHHSSIRLSHDLQYFKHITTRTNSPNAINAVIMGRKTFESIPNKNKPLADRLNIVITSNTGFNTRYNNKSIEIAVDLSHALDLLSTKYYLLNIENVVIIGGASLFEECINHPNCKEFHVTEIDQEFDCDTYLTNRTLDKIKSSKLISESENYLEQGLTYRVKVYEPL